MMTYDKLLRYNNLSVKWINSNPENKETKLGKCIERVSKSVLKALKPIFELNEQRDISCEDITSDNALTNPDTGAFIYDIIKDKEGNDVQKFQFSPASRKKRDIEIRKVLKKYEADLEILLETEVEFTDFKYASEVPKNLTSDEREAFLGIVINPEPYTPKM